MPAASASIAPKKPQARSRISNGRELIPGTDLRGTYPRYMRDTLETLVNHCGGPDCISEPLRLTARRAAVLEAELVHLEAGFAQLRAEGKTPSTDELDLYSRLTNTQRREFEALGWTRTQRDITPPPTLDDIAREIHGEAA